jgi:4-amino-4-deoxy-L-arabinose transferase-like glycosyltransferase
MERQARESYKYSSGGLFKMGEAASALCGREGESEWKMMKPWKILLLLLAFAFLLRLFLIFSPEVIHNDGTVYIRYAKQIASGDWSGGKAPPLYPSLIAGVQVITRDYEMAGIWVSVIFGTLLVLPIFYLGRAIFDEKVGFLSALFVVVHPILYMASGSVLTESTYHFLLATSVLWGWYAFTRGRFSYILLFSFFTTLAYLTRPEAIGFLFIFGIWVLLINPPDKVRRWIRRVGIILLAILGFLVFSSPYLVQIRKETGRWEISKKASVSIGSFSEEEEAPSIETIKRRKGLTLSSFIKNPLAAAGKIGIGILNSLNKFQQIFNPILFLLAVWGLAFLFRKKKPHSLKMSLYLMAYLFFFFGLVLPFFWVTRRYTSQMISISIPWVACGFLGVSEWIHQRFDGKGVRKRIPVFLLIFLLVGLFIQGRVTRTREHRVIQREVGLWMKENLPKGSKVMSRLPQEAFYGEFPWVRMPSKEYEVILGYARSEGVRYLLIEEDIEQISPRFLEKMRRDDLVPVRDFKREAQKIVIFERVERD